MIIIIENTFSFFVNYKHERLIKYQCFIKFTGGGNDVYGIQILVTELSHFMLQ